MAKKNENYFYRLGHVDYYNFIDVTMNYLGGKWKAVVLWTLKDGTLRFSELKDHLPQITEKMLSIQLKNLEDDNLIKRKVVSATPPLRVDYSLTPLGQSMVPVLNEMLKWGKGHAEKKARKIKIK